MRLFEDGAMGEDMCKISVIMPSLNVVNYIQQCINSVLSQTLTDIEIICVDAESTDGTLEILKEYEKKDKRVKVIISTIKSYGYQMNLGIQAARGKYIGIVETDDFVDKEMFAKLYDIAENSQVDFVKSGYLEFVSNGKQDIINEERVVKVPAEFLNKKLDLNSNDKAKFIDPVHIWSGIYSRDFIINNRIKFNETMGASFQDTSFSLLVGYYAKSCVYSDEALYRYRVDNVESSVKSDSKINCIIDEFDYIDSIIGNVKRDTCLYELNRAKIRAYYWNYARLSTQSGEVFRSQILPEMKRLKTDGTFYEWLNCKDRDWLDELVEGIKQSDGIDEEKEASSRLLIKLLQKNCTYCIVSAGVYANSIMMLMRYMNKNNIVSVYDNSPDKKGRRFYNLVIKSLESVCENNKDIIYLVANKHHSEELKKQLELSGISEENIYVFNNLLGWVKLIEKYNGNTDNMKLKRA